MECPLVNAKPSSHTSDTITMNSFARPISPLTPARFWTTALLYAGLTIFITTLSAAEFLPPGFRPIPTGTHVLTGANVIPKPGQSINPGTVVIRDGLIVAVGKDIPAPKEARVWDLKGLTVYAGLIDAYLDVNPTNPPVSTTATQPDRPFQIADGLTSGGIQFFGVPGQERDPGSRGPGSELSPMTPERRVADTFAPSNKTLESLRALGFTAANAVSTRGILPGTSAFVVLSDVNPNDAIIKPDVFQHVIFETEGTPVRAYPRSLMGVIAAVRQHFLDADFYQRDRDHYQQHPLERRRPEFHPARQALVAATQRAMPVVFEPGSALMADRAAQLGRELKLDFHIVSSGQEWRRPDLAKATGATFIVPVHFPELPTMPEEEDWDQVTLDQLRHWDWAPENPAVLRRQELEIALTTYGLTDKTKFRKNLKHALERGLSESDALAALTTLPARLCGLQDRLGTIEPGKIANLTVVQGDSYFNPKARVREVWIDGRVYPVPPEDKSKSAAAPSDPAKTPAEKEPKNSEGTEAESSLPKTLTAQSPMHDRSPIAEPRVVLVRHATLWTSGPQGRLDNADLLVVNGKVKTVGPNLPLPEGNDPQIMVIDATGKHVTPGLIDAHSHSMILGGVNEGTLPSTAMVRIGDVVNSETENIPRQLAGGLTVANLLHGSANPIGGQNAIIKLRRGASPEGLKLEGAPAGIKFALGENVKQSNWGEENTTRFPQTRMGVPAFMANRFTAARQYLDRLKSRKESDPPLRRDLELETLGEILEGQRWIHCHSYRQDEILAFLRLMERFHVQVGTLQHVLEGYKIADEIAAHGAGGSCFSDWWAYKFEVYDAIPYAGSLMRERGVVVSFNSDSSDHARRLYLEAAKAVKYGGTPEVEALKFVSLNPAKQLRIDHRVGSLEPGKDGDFVLWSASPLDSRTVCLQTWIEGKKYFDREVEVRRAEALRQEREQLLDKAKAMTKKSKGDAKEDTTAPPAFFQQCLEHQFDHVNRHCLDHE